MEFVLLKSKALDSNEKKVPSQHDGAKSDISHHVDASSIAEARQLFDSARKNLLSINNWQQISGKLSAEFCLTDSVGNISHDLPSVGHLIRIHLPTASENKFDWVRIEKLEEEDEGDRNMVMLQVRPCQPPGAQTDTEHFFDEDATSSFLVERSGKKVSAMVRGRNEHPNLEAGGLIKKARNVAIAIGAMLGLNTPQWKALVKGILDTQALTP